MNNVEEINNKQTCQTAQIKLETLENIKNFVNIAKQYEFKITLASGKYEVDAKSIVDIFSLDVSENIKLIAHTNNSSPFFEKIEKFLVKQQN